ncbi:hypothetical protein [Deinococcus arenicola]|uniref:Transposase n=1 Tax=Deinococcus arenicola TaxID=2994950 RepID=A0ABU4DVU9_9DEIO|nr:hypothetical protein [Deinococcus sp. ZS9-10]MDV6376568.1 hypothetical protein [Deinococcus sp. ZS9-10]
MSAQKAKPEVVAQVARLACKERLSYDGFAHVCQHARRKLKLEKHKRERRLLQLLTAEELNRERERCGLYTLRRVQLHRFTRRA